MLNALNEYRNMRQAAQAMNTTQPSVSLLLQQLEERLKVKLFKRSPKGMEPTTYGEILIRYARNATHDFEHAEAEIQALSRGITGFIRVGSVTGAVPKLLTKQLIIFQKKYPHVQIYIHVATSDSLYEKLMRGDLDIVLGRLPDQISKHDLEIDYFEKGEEMSIIARPGHFLAKRDKVSLKDLFDQTWILHPMGSPMRLRVETALKQTKMMSHLTIIETASLLATTSMLEASDMISVVPHDVAAHYAKYRMIAILPVKLPISMVNLGIVTRKSKILAPSVSHFINYLKIGIA